MRITDNDYNVTSFGAAVMVIAAILFLPVLAIALWIDMPDWVFKILGTLVCAGFFLAILGLFIPHD